MRTFSLDMIPGGAQTAVSCNQYEAGDVWVFSLYYDGGRYSIPADADVSITGTKPDGAAYNIEGSVVDNAVVITVTDQITACAGRSIAEILVESETDGTTLYSANFPLLVEPAAVQGEFSPSEIPSAIVDTDGNVYYSAEYIPEVSGGVPTEVRQAIKTLFQKAAYIEEGLADEVAVITAWAETTTSITVSPATASVSSTSTTTQLSAVTTPAGGAVTWASSNTAVATVSSNGLVTAVGNGTATITATSGTVSASCAVTVTGFSTLTGIEAVYTQSGTVYDTASLDDLKFDLVVTASYDDSTTETIADYTLSGTLAEGTSTITVTYGGFTDTFTVTVTSSRPSNPYVTDNMTLWLDGIYNKSTGHDASATSWENLITGDLFANTGITVGTDGMVFDGTAGHGFLGDKPSSPATIEVVIDVTTTSTTQCVINGFGNTYNGNVTVKSNALLQRRGSTNGGAHALSTGLHTHTFVIGTAQYVDGTVITDGSTTISLSTEGSKITIGNAVGADGTSLNTTSSGAYPLTGTIKCIRFYSDALTAQEVASNFAVDATRFGIS